MKKALIILALIIILCSASVVALPFKLVVGKQGHKLIDAWSVNPFNFNFYFENPVFVEVVNMQAWKDYNRCSGNWYAELRLSGDLIKSSPMMDICKRTRYAGTWLCTPRLNRGYDVSACKSTDVGGDCSPMLKYNLDKVDLVSIKSTPELRSSCSQGNCHPSIYGIIEYIEGEDIKSAITSKSGIVNFGKVKDLLDNFVFRDSTSSEFVVRSDNQRVLVWVGNRDDHTKPPFTARTTDVEEEVWACYDGDLNQKCDYTESPDCLADYGDYYKGVCCGTDITECKYVSFKNNNEVNAFCAQLNNGEFAWLAKENVGEIFDLDSSYCPADSLISNGTDFYSASDVFDYIYLKAEGRVPIADCPSGYREVDYFEEQSDNIFLGLSARKVRVCEGKKAHNNISINIKTDYGAHEYITSAGDFYECAADFPFSTRNNAELGQNTLELSGLVCPEGAIFYYPLEGNADNFLNQFINGGTNSISFSAGKIGNAALFSTPESDIEIAADQINLNLDEFSFEAWIKPSDVSGKHTIFNSESSVELYLEDGKLKASVYTEDNPNGVFLTSSNSVSTSSWSHVVLAYDGSEIKIYINNNVVDSESVSGKINQGNKPFIIGSRSFLPNEPFEGLIDEVAVYSQALESKIIADHYSQQSSYCYFSNFTEAYYCASDGAWTKDLDIKDFTSCHAASFDWTGHKCCSELDDPGESYSDYSTDAALINDLITEQSSSIQNKADYYVLLEDENAFITVKGPSRIMITKSFYRQGREGRIDPCLEKEDLITSFDLDSDQFKRITNLFYPDEQDCKIGKTKITSLPILAAGGCFNKTFYPSGALLSPNIINYQGEFIACKTIPLEYQAYDFISLRANHCGEPLKNIIHDLNALCLPGGTWYFTNDSRSTIVDDTLWDPVVLNVPNAYKQGCCPSDSCWNGTGCQIINTFYRVRDQGYVCK